MSTIFLLSPASLGGKRGALLLSEEASHPLAESLRSPSGAPIGAVFAFISALYFRGKLAYANHFGRPGAAFVITAGHGLVETDWRLDRATAERMRQIPIDPREPTYRRPLDASVRELAARHPAKRFVLLGSLATGKYLDVLHPLLGSRLEHPVSFPGMGDMKRGSVLLRAVDADRELDYVAWTPPPVNSG